MANSHMVSPLLKPDPALVQKDPNAGQLGDQAPVSQAAPCQLVFSPGTSAIPDSAWACLDPEASGIDLSFVAAGPYTVGGFLTREGLRQIWMSRGFKWLRNLVVKEPTRIEQLIAKAKNGEQVYQQEISELAQAAKTGPNPKAAIEALEAIVAREDMWTASYPKAIEALLNMNTQAGNEALQRILGKEIAGGPWVQVYILRIAHDTGHPELSNFLKAAQGSVRDAFLKALDNASKLPAP